jgi:dTMP kinase
VGKFIVLEGLDGVGKSTLAQGVAQSLGGVLTSTPGSEFASVRGDILQALKQDQLGKALFYAAAVSLQGRIAAEQVRHGGTVVMDRYWASTVAYARARGVTADLDALTPGFAKPDITVLITLDESQRVTRLTQRGATAEDIETLCPTFQATVMHVLRAHCTLAVDVSGLDEQQATGKVVDAIADAACYTAV